MVFSGISLKKELHWLKLSWREEIFYLIIPKTNIEKACHLSVYADINGKIMANYADFHPKYAATTKCCYMAIVWHESCIYDTSKPDINTSDLIGIFAFLPSLTSGWTSSIFLHLRTRW